MPKICVLHVPKMPEPVYVNPVLVRTVESISAGTETRIHFDKDHYVVVQMPVEQVRRLLDVALNADQPG
jgi:hypothetical protein